MTNTVHDDPGVPVLKLGPSAFKVAGEMLAADIGCVAEGCIDVALDAFDRGGAVGASAVHQQRQAGHRVAGGDHGPQRLDVDYHRVGCILGE